jgi:hypothetical protein
MLRTDMEMCVLERIRYEHDLISRPRREAARMHHQAPWRVLKDG